MTWTTVISISGYVVFLFVWYVERRKCKAVYELMNLKINGDGDDRWKEFDVFNANGTLSTRGINALYIYQSNIVGIVLICYMVSPSPVMFIVSVLFIVFVIEVILSAAIRTEVFSGVQDFNSYGFNYQSFKAMLDIVTLTTVMVYTIAFFLILKTTGGN